MNDDNDDRAPDDADAYQKLLESLPPRTECPVCKAAVTWSQSADGFVGYCLACDHTQREQRRLEKLDACIAETLALVSEDAACCCIGCRTERRNGFAGCSVCIDAAMKLAEEKQHRALLKPALLSIPEHFRWSRFEAPELGGRVKSARAVEWLRRIDLKGIVLLHGPSDAGKTTLAAAKFAAEMDRPRGEARFGYASRFVRVVEIGEAAEARRFGQPTPRIIQEALDAPLLVLDDLGFEGTNDVAAAKVRLILATRYDEPQLSSARATVITTGLTADQMATRYGDGFARRCFQGAAFDMGAAGARTGLRAVP